MAKAHKPFRGGAAARWAQNPPEIRFHKNVSKTGLGGCWVWTGRKNQQGYGQMIVRGKFVVVHRMSWEMAHGTIPEGLFVCHKCDNPSCVNPDHLWLGTNRENIADSVKKGRFTRGEKMYSAKLTDEKVKEMRLMHSLGARQIDLADIFGVNNGTVSRIISGKLWKHVNTLI